MVSDVLHQLFTNVYGELVSEPWMSWRYNGGPVLTETLLPLQSRFVSLWTAFHTSDFISDRSHFWRFQTSYNTEIHCHIFERSLSNKTLSSSVSLRCLNSTSLLSVLLIIDFSRWCALNIFKWSVNVLIYDRVIPTRLAKCIQILNYNKNMLLQYTGRSRSPLTLRFTSLIEWWLISQIA